METSNYEGWTPGVDAWERRRVQHEDLRRSLRDHFVGRGYKTEWAEGVGEVKEKGGMVGGAEDGTREGGRWRCTKMSSPTVFPGNWTRRTSRAMRRHEVEVILPFIHDDMSENVDEHFAAPTYAVTQV